MKVTIDAIRSLGIQAEMRRDSYTTAEFFGTFSHPQHPDSRDWDIELYRACDAFVFSTNGDPVWEQQSGFEELVAEYGIDLAAATSE